MALKIGADLKNLLDQFYMSNMAENHLETWKERYYRKSKKQVLFDLRMNHDNSLEIERITDDLKRELTDNEYNYCVEQFHKAVGKIF